MSEQTTFGTVTVNKTRGEYSCDKVVSTDEYGCPITCNNSDKIVIKHESTGLLEFFCGIHARDDWIEMAEE